MNRKGKSINQTVFIGIIKCFAVSTVTTRFRMLFFGVDIGPQSFCHSFIVLPMIMLFEVSPEIRCSCESSRHCYYGNHAAGSKPTLKLFIVVNVEFGMVSLCQK